MMNHNHEPCEVDGCPALVVSGQGLCAIHDGAKRAGHVMVGTRCPNCGRAIESGDWITRESTMEAMAHVHCPPKRAGASAQRRS